MKCFFWLLFIFSSCHLSDQKNKPLEVRLSLIPIEDQQKLEILFQRMMTGDYFAGTLFGSKPVTFQEFHDDPWKLSSYAMVNAYNHFFLDEGWTIWHKYQHIFPSQHFIFTKIPSKGGYEFLILINKIAFKKVFETHRDLFEKALGTLITLEKIFQDFESQQKTFEQVLNDHEGLVGLVLGYGREGSMEVFKHCALERQILSTTLYPLSPPIDNQKLPRNILNSLKWREKKLSQQGVKWNRFVNHIVDASQDPYAELCKSSEQSEFLFPSWQEQIFYILPPNFTIVKGSEEAKQLKKEYNVTMQIARETFKTKSFFRGFLEQYCK